MMLMRLVVGPSQVNCFILADEKTKEAVVIDPGDDAEDILRVIKEKGLKVKYIVNTHGHFDHVGANKAVKDATGAEILMHEGGCPAACFGCPAIRGLRHEARFVPACRPVCQAWRRYLRRRGFSQGPAYAGSFPGRHQPCLSRGWSLPETHSLPVPSAGPTSRAATQNPAWLASRRT